MYLFSGVRWLDPDAPADARLIADGLARLEADFPHLRGATSLQHLHSVIRRTRAVWEPHAEVARLHTTRRTTPSSAERLAERPSGDLSDGEPPSPRRRSRASSGGEARGSEAIRPAQSSQAAAAAAAAHEAACRPPPRRSPRKWRLSEPHTEDASTCTAPLDPPRRSVGGAAATVVPQAARPLAGRPNAAARSPPAAAVAAGEEEWGGVLAAWEAAAADGGCLEWAGLLGPSE
jgi:hypothetical protein